MLLFTAEYRDGFVYRQSPDDASIQEPGKNAWFDIRYKPIRPEEDLVRFAITDGRRELELSLADGGIAIWRLPAKAGETKEKLHQHCLANGPTKGRLVYRKRNIVGFGERPFHKRVHILGIVTPCGEEKIVEVME